MDLILIQSQEHPELPIAELKAVMDAEDIEANIRVVCSGLVILGGISEDSFDNDYRALTRRLGYTHEVNQILDVVDKDSLVDSVNSIDWDDYLDETFVVRVKKFHSDLDTVNIERDIGGYILNSASNVSVKLKGSKSLVRLIGFEDKVFVCLQKYYLDKKYFEEIKPHKRPFFHPGGMSPKLARCMVNLSRVREGEVLLDPFCGTGGMLLEGGLVGAKVVGSDINWKMKNGSAVNLDYAGISDYETYKIDFHNLKMPKPVDAIVTDPPYGISTTTGGVKSEEVIRDFLQTIIRSVKPGGLLVIASPHYVDVNRIFVEEGFVLKEQYRVKMHRSLTRVISVIYFYG